MNLRLHANAATTPRTRRLIQQSKTPVRALARELGISEDTVRKWRQREAIADRSHTPHRLQTTLTPAQEAVVVELRRTLLLSLDDLLTVVREFLHPAVSRSGLDRCLRRHGVSTLAMLRPPPEKVAAKPFAGYAPGFVHVDIKYLPQMPDEPKRRYLFVAIDRASRWVYLELRPDQSARSAVAFLSAVRKAAPFKITRLLTDNGSAFTDRFTARAPQGAHAFDRACAAAGIDHRLIRPRRPQTNGMVERFNGRIGDLLRTNRFRSRDDLATALRRYAMLYNHHIPQKALHHRTPVDTLRHWQTQHPELFVKSIGNLPGPDK